MSRLTVPIQWRVLRSTGDVLLRLEITLLLKTNAGGWELQTFLVDTGSEITTFPAAEAKVLDLPMPQGAAIVPVHVQTGLEVRSGLLRFRVVGMDQTEYVVPCFFLGDPNTVHAGGPATAPRKLFQPFGVLKGLRFTFQDNPAVGAASGEMVVETV